MKRLVHTSQGPLELEIDGTLGLRVEVAMFDEAGWAPTDLRWEKGKGSLADFLTRIARLPADEATKIADETLAGWRSHGGTEDEKSAFKVGLTAIVLFIAVPAVLLVTIAVLAVLLAVR